MNVRQRRKLFAGAGLVSILIGALMVLAPTGAGAVAVQGPIIETGPSGQNAAAECLVGFQQLGVAVPATYAGVKWDGNPDYTNKAATSSYNGMLGTASATKGLNKVTVAYTVNMPAEFAVVKQSSDTKVAIDLSGLLIGSFDFTQDDDLSHVTICSYTPTTPQNGSFTIDKVVTGDLAPAGDPAFQFAIDCGSVDLNGAGQGDDATVGIKASDQVWSSTTLAQLPVGTVCLIEETGTNGTPTVSYTVDLGTATPNAEGQISVTVGNAVKAVVVTNAYGNAQARTGGIAVDKIVTGANGSQSTPFGFTVDCGEFDLNGGAQGTDATFSLTGAAEPWSATGIPAGTQCTVTETDKAGAATTTYSLAGGVVTIVGGQTTAVDVTNNFPGGGNETPPPPPPTTQSLQVNKAVIGAAPDTWNVHFDIDGSDDFQDLVDESDPEGEVFDVDGGEYVITETVSEPDFEGSVDLFRVDCEDADGEVPVQYTGDTATVTVEDGADVVCTFTNIYTRVLPNEVTPPVTPPGPPAPVPPVTPKPEVKGVQVTRQLPRTGSESTDLAGFGAGLLLLGAGLVITSRARRFGIDA